MPLLSQLGLKYNQFVEVNGGLRQIDFMNLGRKVVVEFDGYHHFHDFRGQPLARQQKKDKDLEIHLLSLGFIVIRISYDCWLPHNGRFKYAPLRELLELAAFCTERGVVKRIGKRYQSLQSGSSDGGSATTSK